MLAFLTLSNTYTAAQEIADLLANNAWDDAFVKLSEFVGAERTEVAEKAIALGADPEMISTLITSLQPSETILVTGTAPQLPVAAKPIPWFWILLAALAIGGGIYFYRKRRS